MEDGHHFRALGMEDSVQGLRTSWKQGAGQAFQPLVLSEALEVLSQTGAASTPSSGNRPNLPKRYLVSAPETGGRLEVKTKCLLWIHQVGVQGSRSCTPPGGASALRRSGVDAGG